MFCIHANLDKAQVFLARWRQKLITMQTDIPASSGNAQSTSSMTIPSRTPIMDSISNNTKLIRYKQTLNVLWKCTRHSVSGGKWWTNKSNPSYTETNLMNNTTERTTSDPVHAKEPKHSDVYLVWSEHIALCHAVQKWISNLAGSTSHTNT